MSIDEKPLTIIVSETLDPRVRRKLESQLLPDVKTQEEFDDQLKADEKAKQEQQRAEEEMAKNPEPPKDDSQPEQKPAEQNNSADDSGDKKDDAQQAEQGGGDDPFGDSGSGGDPFGDDSKPADTTPAPQSNDQSTAPAPAQEPVQQQPAQTPPAQQAPAQPAPQPAQTQAPTPQPEAAQPAPVNETQEDPFANSKAANAGDENPFSANEDENASNDQFVKQSGAAQQPAPAQQKPADKPANGDDPFADASDVPAEGGDEEAAKPDAKDDDNGSNSGGTDPFDSNVAFEHADLQTTEGLAALFGNRPPPRLSMETMQQDQADAKINLAKRLMVIDPPQAGLSNSTNLMIQMLKDPENTLAIVNYDDAPTVDAKVKLTKYEEQLKDRGVQTFKDAPTAVEYINQLYNDLKTTTSGGE